MTEDTLKKSDEQTATKNKAVVQNKEATTTKTTEQKKQTQAIKTANNKNKKASANASAFVINEIKPAKRTPTKMLEMQRAFVENYYNLPPSNMNGANKEDSATNEGGNGQNPPLQQTNNGYNPGANAQGVGTLGQIAPLFNLLGGGKNAQIGSLISALGDGKMDMNKVISAMAPSAGGGGAGNLFSGMFNNNTQSKKANTTPKEQPTNSGNGKSIKDLHKI